MFISYKFIHVEHAIAFGLHQANNGTSWTGTLLSTRRSEEHCIVAKAVENESMPLKRFKVWSGTQTACIRKWLKTRKESFKQGTYSQKNA